MDIRDIEVAGQGIGTAFESLSERERLVADRVAMFPDLMARLELPEVAGVKLSELAIGVDFDFAARLHPDFAGIAERISAVPDVAAQIAGQISLQLDEGVFGLADRAMGCLSHEFGRDVLGGDTLISASLQTAGIQALASMPDLSGVFGSLLSTRDAGLRDWGRDVLTLTADLADSRRSVLASLATIANESVLGLNSRLADVVSGTFSGLVPDHVGISPAMMSSLLPEFTAATTIDAALRAILDRVDDWEVDEREEIDEGHIKPLLDRLLASGSGWLQTVSKNKRTIALHILLFLIDQIAGHILDDLVKLRLESANRETVTVCTEASRYERRQTLLQKKQVKYAQRSFREQRRELRWRAKHGGFAELGDEHRVVTASALVLRAEPRPNGRPVGKVPLGTVVLFIGKQGRWSLVRYLDQHGEPAVAWAFSKYLLSVDHRVTAR